MILSTRFGNSRYRRLQTAISWLSLCPVMLLSCAKQPRPAVLSELDAVRQTQAAVEAAAFAPQSYAEAEGLRDTAEREWQAGHAASSQIAAERALSAYERTRTLARIVRTERDLVQTQFQLKESKAALSQLEARQKQVAAEQADLEMQLKVERDAEQLAAPSPTNPAREAARREVARALSAQGRLLCASARLLSAPLERIEAKYKQLDQLDAARGPEFDRLFLTFMIQHHSGAVTMVHDLFAVDGAGQGAALFKLASNIQADQITEIERMKKMLAAMPDPGAGR